MRKPGRRVIALPVAAWLGALALGTPVRAQQPSALEVMNQSHLAYYYAGDGGRARVVMVLADVKGRTRDREFWIARRDVQDMGDQHYFTYFLKPADVARTAFMVHKKAEGNDDRWLFIPAVDLVKRIAAQDRGTSFVGSDFAYEDISGRLPSLDVHELVGPDTAMGRATTRIKSTPKDPQTSAYSSWITWVDDETKLPLRQEYLDRQGRPARRLTLETIATIEGIPTATARTMTNLKTGHYTTITFSELTYRAMLKPEEFSERLLKNPPAEFTR